MKDDWINVALIAGGVMTVSRAKGRYRATMNFRHRPSISGYLSGDISSAIEDLNETLLDDAAEEMTDAGVV